MPHHIRSHKTRAADIRTVDRTAISKSFANVRSARRGLNLKGGLCHYKALAMHDLRFHIRDLSIYSSG